jgi:hypothetical protein
MSKTSKEQLLEAISALVPEDAQKKITDAVETFFEETRKELDSEYDDKLREAYETLTQEKEEAEKVAVEGYSQAYEMICELRDRFEIQREEFDQVLNDGYKEAYDMLMAEKQKNENLELGLYDEYENKLKDIKKYIVEKMDVYLNMKAPEFAEAFKQEVLSDPSVAEHRVALDKFLEVAANYLNEDHYINATSRKVEEVIKTNDQLKDQVRILEAKNMRLATENSKLNESVHRQQEVLTESVRNEQKERAKKAVKAEGKGKLNTNKEVVIGEYSETPVTSRNDESKSTRFVESTGDINEQWAHLAGLDEGEEE